MNPRIIVLCYRKIIGPGASKQWDRFVFEDSYTEFRLQAQNFTQGTPYTSYADLIRNIPVARELAARITPAIAGYVQQLGGIVPDVIDQTGKRFLPFNRFQLEIINSDIQDQARHQIAVNFYSVPMVWHDTVGNLLLVSPQQPAQAGQSGEAILTTLFQLVPYVTIHSLISS